ncbi:MAG TPA: hypothetical protein PKW90_09555 [Myxococcota bacterium]|nr:hypothetical protein [Myxococcota bacterium]
MLWMLMMARAADTVVAVMPGVPVEDPRLRAAVVRVLSATGYDRALLMAPESLADAMDFRGLRPTPPPCHQPLGSWRLGMDLAVEMILEDEWEEAEQLLRRLEDDLRCLQQSPDPDDLLDLRLAQAWLARQGERIHEDFGNAPEAIAAAASLGKLPTPEDMDPDILEELEARRQRQGGTVPVAVAGPEAAKLRIDGYLPTDGVFELHVGPHLYWLEGEEVEGYGELEVRGPTLLWLPGDAPITLPAAVVSLGRKEPPPEEAWLLAAASRLVDQPLVYVGVRGRQVDLWVPVQDHLLEVTPQMDKEDAVEAGLPDEGVEVWRATYGISLGGAWSNQETVGGFGGGVGVFARWRLNPFLNLSFAANPVLLPGEERGLRGTVPLRVGIHYGRQSRRWTADLGVDVGMEWLGQFRPDSTGFLLGGSGGASGALGPRTGLRVEVWAAAGLDHGMAGLNLGVEARLPARTVLVESTTAR